MAFFISYNVEFEQKKKYLNSRLNVTLIVHD
jgi:hypothetical protein